MEEMAIQHIVTDVTINENIPLNSDITVKDELKVNINMLLETEIPFRAEIPVDQNLLIPFKIGVHDYIKLDTTIKRNILIDRKILFNNVPFFKPSLLNKFKTDLENINKPENLSLITRLLKFLRIY